jgi:putative transposase
MVSTLLHYRAQGRYLLHSYVVMPDHVHLLLTPAPDVSLEKVIQYVRGGFSFRMESKLDVWERGHFDKRLASSSNYRACIRYIEENPVKAGLAVVATGYPFSSAGRHLDAMPEWMQ